MANTFEIALVNPLRFVKAVVDADKYILSPFDLDTSVKYLQKFTRKDSTKIQVLSDFEFTFKIYKSSDNSLVSTLIPVENDSGIIGQTFKIYEVSIDFSLLAVGIYYCEIVYTNEADEEITYTSECIDVQNEHENTIVFEYTNSENNFSVVFETEIEFSLRVEGNITNFTPEFDDIIYNDQKRNATKLDSIPYRSFELFIGNAAGIPEWMADKVNRLMSCDQIKIEGVYYEKTEGAKWEIQKPDLYNKPILSINIMPVENFFLQKLQLDDIGGNNDNEFTPVQKIKNYFETIDDISMIGFFKKYTLLEKICIINTGDPFTLNVGTTNGGSEIGAFEIADMLTTQTINWLFGDVTNVYLTGLDENTKDISVIYKQLDTAPISGSPNPYKKLGVGATMVYKEVSAGMFEVDFNLGTGFGNVDTDWDGWALCDGRNGTDDMGGVGVKGFIEGHAEYGNVGGVYGKDVNNLTDKQNGPHFHILKHGRSKRGMTGTEKLLDNFNQAFFTQTESSGEGEDIENRSRFRVVYWVTKIAEVA